MLRLLLSALLITNSLTYGSIIFVSNTGSPKPCGDGAGSPCDSITTALSFAAAGDTITLMDGVYSGPNNTDIIISVNSLTINSLNGYSSTSINVNDSSAFTVSNKTSGNEAVSFSVQGITFINATTSESIVTSYGDQNVSLSIDSCAFLNNTVGDNGVIFISDAAQVSITNCIFSRNRVSRTSGYGGSIHFVDVSSAVIQNSVFKNGQANQGGAIWLSNSYTNLSGCSFQYNLADRYGGDIYVGQHSRIFLNNCNFDNSTSRGNGGSIEIFSASLRCNECKFTGCFAASYGGALSHDYGAYGSCVNCHFDSNVVYYYSGGAVFVGENARYVSNSSTYSDNVAASNGGAIGSDYGNIALNNDNFTDNGAAYGGALSFSDQTMVHMDDIYLGNNVGYNGGAIFCSASTLYINHTQTFNNTDNTTDPNIFCSLVPALTYCTVSGDEDWSTMCGDSAVPGGYRLPELSPLAIFAIALLGASCVLCIIVTIAFVSYRRKVKKAKDAKDLWKKVGGVKPDDDDMELLEDYDEN